jgi:putative acetyltransferase
VSSGTELLIRTDDPGRPEVRPLLRAHLEFAAEHSPRESIHALDVNRLRAPEVTFWTIWSGGTLVGCGALKELARDHGEVKSMHTERAHRGKGVARTMLRHLLDEARRRAYSRVSLETGAMVGFAPARALYAAHGFEVCAPFADYPVDANSICMTLEIEGVLPA